MHYFLPVLKILFPGLLASLLLGFLHIRYVIKPVLQMAEKLQTSGILAVPHGSAIHTMDGVFPSLQAAFLFVFSIGAGLSIGTFAFAWASRNLVRDSRWISIPATGLWAALLLFINHKGPVFFPSLWIFLIPAITWKNTLACIPRSQIHESPFHKPAHLLPILLLALAALPLLSKGIFLDIRDSILFSTKPGLAISNAYYRHTLSAAEVIKPVAARQIKIYASHTALPPDTEKKLTDQGWHRTETSIRPHIRLIQTSAGIDISGKGIRRTLVPDASFHAAPGRILDQATLDGDRLDPFRLLILFSLVPGFPLLLYALFFCPMRRILSSVFDRPSASIVSSILCLAAGISLLLPVHFLGKTEKGPQETEILNAYLLSEKRSQRLHAIRMAAKGRQLDLPPSLLQQYLLEGDTAERYWAAAFLGSKPSEKYWHLLLAARKDPQANVLCKTVEALALTGPALDRIPEARNAILQTLRETDHPYVQWYAFRALKKLGPLPGAQPASNSQ
ncbi:hypothetical protein OOT00_15520 [Desulfobotulus sp. H1]|uniref:HEAT repeat domain-containing protein n=1 Tax=Desulfobotulus pelophilus TaxID=2823377 RepID=A0ABT3ND47_9BACT|nr:hypothetical protein [Desulfobotulus pelophilus]MCW7755391.1 hypothetical protein [Desulfobotulus pelophilus]